jgi:lipopolysaccharide biosynthesis protein
MVLDDSLFFIISYCNAIIQDKFEENYYNAIYKLTNYMDEFETQQQHQT